MVGALNWNKLLASREKKMLPTKDFFGETEKLRRKKISLPDAMPAREITKEGSLDIDGQKRKLKENVNPQT